MFTSSALFFAVLFLLGAVVAFAKMFKSALR